MLQNPYFLTKIGADTAENEQHFAENLQKIGNYPTGPLRLRPGRGRGGRRKDPLVVRDPRAAVEGWHVVSYTATQLLAFVPQEFFNIPRMWEQHRQNWRKSR